MPQLAEAKIPGKIFIHEASSEQRQRVRDLGFTVFDEPQPLDQVLSEAKVVIHHGGIGVTTAAISIGRPQVLLPRYLEQRLTGKALYQMRIGANFYPQAKVEAIVQSVKMALTEDVIGDRAQSLARQVMARGPYDALSKIVTYCLSKLEANIS